MCSSCYIIIFKGGVSSVACSCVIREVSDVDTHRMTAGFGFGTSNRKGCCKSKSGLLKPQTQLL